MSRILRVAHRVAERATNKLEQAWFTPLARRKLARFNPPYKLHFACGTVRFDDWVNIDLLPASRIVDVSWDVRWPFPLPGGTCRYIFHEHFLEHLDVADGTAFVRECHRLLEPGGVLRIAMPNLSECVRQYWEDDWRDKPWMKKHGYEWIGSGAEYLNITFREWEHRWLYDQNELHRRLREAGFAEIHDCQAGESAHDALRNRETRLESLLVAEAVK